VSRPMVVLTNASVTRAASSGEPVRHRAVKRSRSRPRAPPAPANTASRRHTRRDREASSEATAVSWRAPTRRDPLVSCDRIARADEPAPQAGCRLPVNRPQERTTLR
jgi:hypothetical protein